MTWQGRHSTGSDLWPSRDAVSCQSMLCNRRLFARCYNDPQMNIKASVRPTTELRLCTRRKHAKGNLRVDLTATAQCLISSPQTLSHSTFCIPAKTKRYTLCTFDMRTATDRAYSINNLTHTGPNAGCTHKRRNSQVWCLIAYDVCLEGGSKGSLVNRTTQKPCKK